MSDFRQLIKLCEGKKIYIQTHNFPDPDAIASAFGLQYLLSRYNISSKICYEGKIDKISTQKMLWAFHIEIFPYKEIINELKDDDCIICIDSQKNGGNITDFIGEEIACIDHHPTFVPIEYKYMDVQITGACASIIAEYIYVSEWDPSEDVATALIYGMKMDTLDFSRGVTQKDIKMFSYLFDYHNASVLSLLKRSNMEFNDLKAYGAAIEHISLHDFTGFSAIPFPCSDAMVAILSDFILSLSDIEIVIISSKRNDGIKLSIRSECDEIHAGDLARKALAGIGDGGGHASMAGGHISNENLPLLGENPDIFLLKRFSDTISQTVKENYQFDFTEGE